MFRFEPYLTNISSLCVRFGVRRLVAFGSAVRGNLQAKSDIDLLVSFHPEAQGSLFARLMDFHVELETLFQRKVDLLPAEGLRNPVLLVEIQKCQQVLYGA